jgi:hypothetical protein
MPPEETSSGDVDDLMPAHQAVVRPYIDDQQRLLSALQEEQALTHTGHVYHYTGDVGLFQIIMSGLLWMSDYTTLNDPSEISYGMGIGVDALKAELTARNNPVLGTHFVRVFEGIAATGLHTFLSAYVLSMSVAADELTQW